MSTKGKRTFWVAKTPTELHHRRAKLLKQNGYDIFFAHSPIDVFKLSHEGRPISILIDPPVRDDVSTMMSLQALIKEPEFNGVRFIASLNEDNPDFLKLALSENFREIIPEDITDERWIYRVLFANASRSGESLNNIFEVGLNQIASTACSGRITWISENQMRIEMRGTQKVGSSFQISGPMAQALGLQNISLTVLSIDKTKLLYRYSQALVCSWSLPPSHLPRVKQLITQFLASKSQPKFRAFVAVSRQSLRSTLVKSLDPARFVVRTALRRANIPLEISYFSPHILFVDDKILDALSDAEFENFNAQLPKSAPIVIFGNDTEKSRKYFADREVFTEPAIQQDNLQVADQRYGVTHESNPALRESETFSVAAEHPWSKITAHVPARLTALSAFSGKLSLPFSIGKFTLATLEVPLLRKALGRDPIIKITETSETDSSMFAHQASFYLVDVTAAEQTKLASILINLLKDYYASNIHGFVNSTQLSLEAVNSEDVKLESAASGNSVNAVGSNDQHMLLDTATLQSDSLSGGGFDGSGALKESGPSKAFRDISAISETFEDQDKKISKPRAVAKTAFYGSAKSSRAKVTIDTTIIKAIAVLGIFAAAMVFALKMAEKIGENRQNELGKEYSDFFIRMNPELRKKLEKSNSNEDSNP